MAIITLTIPDAVAGRVLDGFCAFNGYQETILDDDNITMIANPETKPAFAKRKLLEKVEGEVIRHEANLAATVARDAALAAATSEIVLS